MLVHEEAGQSPLLESSILQSTRPNRRRSALIAKDYITSIVAPKQKSSAKAPKVCIAKNRERLAALAAPPSEPQPQQPVTESCIVQFDVPSAGAELELDTSRANPGESFIEETRQGHLQRVKRAYKKMQKTAAASTSTTPAPPPPTSAPLQTGVITSTEAPSKTLAIPISTNTALVESGASLVARRASNVDEGLGIQSKYEMT